MPVRRCPRQVVKEALTRFDRQLDGRADLVLDLHIHEFRKADYVDAVVLEVASGESQRLDGLVHCSGSDGLHFRMFVLTNDPGNCPGNGRGAGVG